MVLKQPFGLNSSDFILQETRSTTIQSETRVIIVPTETRNFTIASETRTFKIPIPPFVSTNIRKK